MNRSADDPKVGLDSQCFTYLIGALAKVAEPTDELAEERKALIRSWFYMPGTYYLPQTVVTECQQIRTTELREFHTSFVASLFITLPIKRPGAAAVRAVELRSIHPGLNDCRILAEAEDLGLKHLLTFDRDLLQRLGSSSNTVTIQTPSAYWSSLAIPRGANLRTSPHESNPLSQETWWRW